MRPLDRLYAAGFVVAWSSGFIGVELGTRDASAVTLLTWRFLVLALPAAAWIAHRRSRFAGRDLRLHLVIGAFAQVGYLSGVAFAAQLGVAPGVVSLIAGLQPLIMAVAAAAFLSERTSRLQVLGLLIGLAGVALVVSVDGGGPVPLWAYALPLGSVLSLVAATVVERRTRPDSLGPIDALAVQFLFAAIAFTMIAAAGGYLRPAATPDFWAGVILTVVLAGIGGYGLYWAVVHRSGATVASSLLYLTPPTTLLWAWAMFGDQVTGRAWAGLAVTALGVALALRRGPGPPPHESSTAGYPGVTERR
ncbi:DMT family transporter [Glycomyces harbinensis]|uniref:Permease of the drug/metabolite transporter (DMT) superfamily n=1 Tax=Glycomyces harbinensis TaxID=58114 RepID=A0A1G7AQ00_9ACTN|nr:DMT family transporter [Glycomyces harbinensis]SDE16760.1 Permease of the drug/metabolite transporter (DMT) superfamily [Glycomyces harbinensis]